MQYLFLGYVFFVVLAAFFLLYQFVLHSGAAGRWRRKLLKSLEQEYDECKTTEELRRLDFRLFELQQEFWSTPKLRCRHRRLRSEVSDELWRRDNDSITYGISSKPGTSTANPPHRRT